MLDVGVEPNITVLKDTRLEARTAYSLPVRLDPRLTTRLKIFNPMKIKAELCLFLFFGEEGYTYPIKEIGPEEFLEIDLLKARDKGLPGELGRTISPNAESGQIKAVLHLPADSQRSKRLVALGEIEEPSGTRSISFQGCTACLFPILCDTTINKTGTLP